MKHKGLIGFVLFILTALSTGCGSSSGLKTEDDWRRTGSRRVNTPAVVYVNSVDIHCKLLSARQDYLIVSVDGKERQIPSEVVSKVVFSGSESRKSRMILGSSVGTVVGGLAGYFVGREANSGRESASNLGHPAAILLIVGGASAGAWMGGRGTSSEAYTVRGSVTPYIMHESLGEELTPAEIKMYGLFEGLVGEDDQLLQVQTFKLNNEKYFLLMDVRRYGEYAVDWTTVDEAYISAEKGKVK